MVTRNWRDLIRPNAVEIDLETLTPSYGRFVCEPLERGYGTTLGNALRRALLSSLEGVAITAVRFLPGEDDPMSTEEATEILLNLKEVVLRAREARRFEVRLVKEGPGVVRAGDIATCAGIEVVNPDHVIAAMTRRGPLGMDLTIEVGRGYGPAGHDGNPEAPPGTIPLDALFSPVRKVIHTVSSARVGSSTDYDRLTLEVWTDGSVRPQQAVAFAARILGQTLTPFINFEEEAESAVLVPEEQALDEHLFTPVEELELSVRAANCLRSAHIVLIGELVQRTEGELMKMRGFGRKSLREIDDTLKVLGLGLGMKLADWPGMLARWHVEEAAVTRGDFPRRPGRGAPPRAA
jgi:DNA-directed RNA polymerase subunit alpha